MGTLVPKEDGHTLLLNTLLAIPPWSRKPPLIVGSPNLRARPMQHVVNKALTHASNHRHGSAGHNQGSGGTPKAADVDVFGKPNLKEGGR